MSNEYNYILFGIIPEIYFTIFNTHVNLNLSCSKIANVLPECSVTKSFFERRGIIEYIEYQSLSLRRNWVPPHPLPRKLVSLPSWTQSP